ncbi:Ribonuclease D [hydrothermal vent metagenome]|uniref:Ribonuclease D n=1 Tax=hydrothermal vent metagenome TaxID=652676 RepID=A0A3B0S2W0_9ZZZZ
MQILTKTTDLAKACELARQADFVAVDTEFMRERTFWSKLCLIQMATDEVEAIIDPLADGLDMTPFLDLLRDSSVVKVFHAARQDMEIFYTLLGEVPAPIFDSQVAAMAAGLGDSIGYDKLVKATLGINVDKGSRFTDWSRRPLSSKQLTYAIGDVTHLRDLYPILVERLRKQDRLHWLDEEMALLANPEIYTFEPELAWKRMKIRKYTPKWLAVMRLAAEWREREAQRLDRPRGRILKDDAIYEIAMQAPTSREELGRLRAVPNGFERSNPAQGLLAAVQKALENPEQYAPDIAPPQRHPAGMGPVVEMLKVLLRIRAEEIGVAPRLIANTADIERLAASDEADIPALRGWRKEEFGQDALAMKAGNVGLRLKNGKIVLER